jgi:ankyrin repeat protein
MTKAVISLLLVFGTLGFLAVLWVFGKVSPPPATNIWEACRYGDLNVLRRELAAGVDPNAQDPRWHDVPLACAAVLDHAEAVQILLHAGADPNVGYPLVQAVYADAFEVTALLLKAGADPNLAEPSGKAPLHYAAISDSESSMKLIITAGAEIDMRSPGGWTPLLMAASVAKVDNVKILLRAGADKELRTDEGLSGYDLAHPRGPLSSRYKQIRQLLGGGETANE